MLRAKRFSKTGGEKKRFTRLVIVGLGGQKGREGEDCDAK